MQLLPVNWDLVSVGKRGLQAEVIGIPAGSIGEKLYKAKVYLETPDLFAWTIVIIAVSVGLIRFLCLCLEEVWRITIKRSIFVEYPGQKMLPFL